MTRLRWRHALCPLMVTLGCQPSTAVEPERAAAPLASALATAAAPPAASAAADFRVAAAAYLDEQSDAWLNGPHNTGSNFQCAVSCHTTHAFGLARHHLAGDQAVDDRLYEAVAERVRSVDDWRKSTPMYGEPASDKERQSRGTEAVLHASLLAHSAAARPGRQALIDKAFEHLWATQREDGSWEWLNFGLQPAEADNEDWGAALAALAVGRAGKQAEADKLNGYLQARLASGQMRLHARALLLWAASGWPGLLDEQAQRAIVVELVAAQLPDGGWSTATLGFSSSPNAQPLNSDGYASALSTLALCALERSPAVEKGLAWLKGHQRRDGAWPAQSLNGDSPRAHRYMSDAATGYAVLALTQCR